MMEKMMEKVMEKKIMDENFVRLPHLHPHPLPHSPTPHSPTPTHPHTHTPPSPSPSPPLTPTHLGTCRIELLTSVQPKDGRGGFRVVFGSCHHVVELLLGRDLEVARVDGRPRRTVSRNVGHKVLSREGNSNARQKQECNTHKRLRHHRKSASRDKIINNQ